MIQEPPEKDLEPRVRASRFARLLQIIRFYNVLSPRATTQSGAAKPDLDIVNPAPLSQRQLARVLGVSSTMVHRYESGSIDPFEVGFGVLVRLAVFASIEIDDLRSYFSDELIQERSAHSPVDSRSDQGTSELIDLIRKLQGAPAYSDSV